MLSLSAFIRSVFIILIACVLTGCGGYALQGRVVKGRLPMATLVEPDDEALALGDPVAGAEVSLWRDPGRLNREQVASARAGADGWFTLPVEAFGAGWMEEEWEVRAASGGYQRTEQFITLPMSGGGSRLLIIMTEGPSYPDPRDQDLMDEVDRYR